MQTLLVRRVASTYAYFRAHPDKFGLSLAAVFLLAALASIRRTKGGAKAVPGPRGYPVFGNVFLFTWYANRGRIPELYMKLHDQYGDTFLLNIMGTKLVVTRDPELVRRALTDASTFRRSDFAEKRMEGLANAEHGLFILATAEKWKHHRKTLQPAFGPSHLRHMGEVSREDTARLGDYWASLIQKSGNGVVEVDMFAEMTCLTLDVIGKVAFSYDFGSMDSHHKGTHSEGHQIMLDIGALISQRISNPPMFWRYVGIANDSPRVRKVQEYVNNLFGDIIMKKKQVLDHTKDWKAKDVLDRLLGSSADGKPVFPENEMIGEILAFFFAGHETTANTLTFVFLELSRHPVIQKRLKQEIKSVLAKLEGNVTVENLSDFKYLDQVVREAQRLHTVVVNVGRSPIKTFEHNGFEFSPDMRVLCHFRGLHHDPKFWNEPLNFNPDRWNEPITASSYLPFGEGPHNCIGQKMALIEAKMALIEIMSRFSVEFVEDQELVLVFFVTYGLKKGLKLKLISDA
ncbi:cytochrome P450 [Chytriomyces sp. MP71]|nr:cytochrome P450 [Chytriomyces sp. MP71]